MAAGRASSPYGPLVFPCDPCNHANSPAKTPAHQQRRFYPKAPGRSMRTATILDSTAPLADDAVLAPPETNLTEPRPLLGIVLVVGATFLFACCDTTNKVLVAEFPVPLVMAARYITHCLLMLAILTPRHGLGFVRTERTGLVIFRAACLVAGSLLMGLGLQRIPVAEATSVVFLAPLLVILLARPLLGERIGVVGWAASLAGFAGVVLIVRPGAGLDPVGVGFVLCNVLFTTTYYLLSRILARTERTLALLFYSALAGAICFGLVVPWFWGGVAPGFLEAVLLLSLGVTAGLGHWMFTAANRFAGASLLAPISYLQLLWAGLLGWAVFGHMPDSLSMVGMAVVTAAGVAVALRSRLVSTGSPPAKP